MKNSPWAKLMSRATPSINASPAATMAYIAPRVRPCRSGSRTSKINQYMGAPTWPPPGGSGRPGGGVAPLEHAIRSIEERGACRQLFHDAELAVAHLDQDHVDPGLVVVVELDRSQRRVLDVHLLQRGTDGLPIGLALLLERDLQRRHHRPLERDGREAAVDARRHLVALGPLLVPVRVQPRHPVTGLDDAVADLGVVAHPAEELG